MDTRERRTKILELFEDGLRVKRRMATLLGVNESTIRKDWKTLGLDTWHKKDTEEKSDKPIST